MTKLDRCWKDCLRMWKWISETWKPRLSVGQMKKQWLNENGFNSDKIHALCFFCEHAGRIIDDDGVDVENCADCPASIVEPGFDCGELPHNYSINPKAFYAKLLELDAKRKGTNQ